MTYVTYLCYNYREMNTNNYIHLYRIYVVLTMFSDELVSPYENVYMKISV